MKQIFKLFLFLFIIFSIESDCSSIYENYSIVKEVGKGTFSTVFLSKSRDGEWVAIKKYEITDESLIKLFVEKGVSCEAFVKTLAEKELQIGQMTDHPNVVKIREIYFEEASAFVVMDFLEGELLSQAEIKTSEMRIALAQQLIDAVMHLLLRNIVLDDAWSGNILISQGSHLTLIDLGGNEIIQQDANMPLQHYIDQIEHVIGLFGEEATKAVKFCSDLIPSNVRKEKISSNHLKPLIKWIDAIQKNLDVQEGSTPVNTIYASSSDEILKEHAQLQTHFSEHFSFSTAQHSNFLAYSLVAKEVLKKFNPGKYPKSTLENRHFLRYPFETLPKNLKDLFKQLPVRDDYDTVSSLVSEALISVSPSLNETEVNESAWAIFDKNEREGDVSEHIHKIFDYEKVSPQIYKNKIQKLIEESPKSEKGLIYTYFVLKKDPLYQALYLSQPYGIPIGDPLSKNGLVEFFKKYQQGDFKENNTQLRFLPSALISENNFTLNQIKSYRFTTILENDLLKFSQKVEKVVTTIYQQHLEEMLGLAALAREVEALKDINAQQEGYLKLCQKHLLRKDICLSFYYWNKLEEQTPKKYRCLTTMIACLLAKNHLKEAAEYFKTYEAQFTNDEKDQLAARFALLYIEQDQQLMLDLMLEKIENPQVKHTVLVLASSRYPQYLPENPDHIDPFLQEPHELKSDHACNA